MTELTIQETEKYIGVPRLLTSDWHGTARILATQLLAALKRIEELEVAESEAWSDGYNRGLDAADSND